MDVDISELMGGRVKINEGLTKLDMFALLLDRAGHFRYFLTFSTIKKDLYAFFIKLITYFCISPI